MKPITMATPRSVSTARSVARAALVVATLTALAPGLLAAETPETIRVGIIGLDAHAVPWTQIIHNPAAKPPISRMRIVAAVATPSPDIPFSADNNHSNITTMRQLGVEIVDSIDAMLAKVDAVMLLSIDGRPHLEQARPVFKSRKPLFIDKPIAASLADVMAIFRLAEESGTAVFSNSSLRYGPSTAAISKDAKLGRVLGCDTYCSSKSILPGHPDLFYYGIHGCDMLFGIMGTGAKSVRRVKSATADFVVGTWNEGRIGTFRGILEGSTDYGATAFCERGVVHAGKFEGYEPLLMEIATFFKTRKAPVSVEETLEIYAFLEAADESLRQGGLPVSLENTLEKSRTQAAKKF